MRWLVCLLLYCCVPEALGQTYPRLTHTGIVYGNNSFIDRGSINQNNPLICETDHTPCCNNEGGWVDPEGMAVQEGVAGAATLYVTRTASGAINLHRITEGLSGMWQCEIPDSSGQLQQLYIYLGGTTTGSLTSAVVSFGGLLSSADAATPEFFLTCRSEGGPAMAVSWERDSSSVTEDSEHEASQLLVDTGADTVYENRLRVEGREPGDYECTVNNNRGAFFGSAGSTVTSDPFTVEVAGLPTRVNAVDLLEESSSILVTWDPPQPPVTGFMVYLHPVSMSQMVEGGEMDTHTFTDLESRMDYTVTMVALSNHLPSTETDPVTPSTLSAPTVTISEGSDPGPYVGSGYTLSCEVVVPDGITLSGPPRVEFEAPTGQQVVAQAVMESATVFSASHTFSSLSLFSSGEYTCTATYSENGQDGSTSPDGTASLSLTVTIEPPNIGFSFNPGEVPYISNSVTFSCSLSLDGVQYLTDVDVSFSWTKDGAPLPGSITVVPTESVFSFVVTRLQFTDLQLTDNGLYECQATITPQQGTVLPLIASDSYILNVITPTVTVETTPTNVRVLDDAAFNDFSINCSASADVDGTALALGEIVWERGVDGANFQPVSLSDYNTSSSVATGYLSVLQGSESDTGASYHYRCRASLSPGSDLSGSSTSTVTVSGPMLPASVIPRANDILDTHVLIVWTVFAITYTPETYRVDYGTDSEDLSRMSGTVSSGPDINAVDLLLSLPLTGLQPDTTYHYKVVATNSYFTTESEVLSFTTTPPLPDPPTDLTAELDRDDPTSLTYIFSWTPPPNTFILGYTVMCTPSLSGVEPEVSTVNMTTTTLTLDHGLSYTCCVWVSNSVGPSNRTCLPEPINTPITAPDGPPLNFQAIPQATSLVFSWDPPQPSLRNGPIISYSIECSTEATSSSAVSATVTSPQHTASGLTPNSNYTCTVLATNEEGDGPPATYTIATLEDVPSAPPRGFSYSVMNGTTDVLFRWRPPPADSINGVITLYTLSCGSSQWLSEDLREMVTSLTPASDHSCNVSASTSVGEGPVTEPVVLLTVPGAPEDLMSEVREDGEAGLLLSWGPVEGLVSSYRVVVMSLGRGETVVLTVSSTSLLLTSQEVGGYERVRVEVAAVNDAGYGPASEPHYSRTPSIAPGPVGELTAQVADDIVNISWMKPDYPNGILTGYSVTFELYQGRSTSIEPVEIDGNATLTTQVNISSLEDGVPYVVVVVAVNEVGVGERATHLFYAGELTAGPVVLMAGNQSRSSNGDILLSWEKPDPVQARGEITDYLIQFAEAGATDGEEEEEGGGRRKRQGECPRDLCQLEEGETSGCCLVGGDETSTTISGLDPSRDYEVSVTAINGAGEGDTQTLTVKGTPPSSEDDSFPVAIVAGVVIAVVVVALVVVLVILVLCFVCRKRRKSSYRAYHGAPSPSMDEKPRGAANKEEEAVQLQAVNVVARNPEEEARMRSIPLSQFEEHVAQMHQDRDKGFELEYQTFSSDPTASSEAAKNAKNKNKNRFANIFPYDNNRVKLLEQEGVEGSDYINASLVNGYGRSNAYIAAQGPMSGTILDFWRMIWEHRLSTIIMLTKNIEGGKRKCEVYWPDKVGGTFNAGSGILVQYKQLIPYADYETKIFTVTQAGKNIPPLEVHHFQFLSWPDHGVPIFATALISFIRRLRLHHNPQSSMLVHCSAGVGRTGAFILLDSMLERIMSEDTVNVYEFLTRMRQQRVHMVQTLAQYVFIHDALVELITCGNTSIPAKQLRKQIMDMHKIIPEKTVSGFTDQFRLLQRKSRRPTDGDNSDGLEPYNKDKNRYSGRLPYNMNRVRLSPTSVTGADYINASFIDGYKQQMAYIAAQAPLTNTVNDFWKMMWEFKSRAIVMLCQLTESGQEVSHQYWPSQLGAKQLYGKNSVTLVSEENPLGAAEVIVRRFQITDDKNNSSFSITQYQVLSWPENGRLETQLLIQLIDHLNKLQRSTENKPITVMCNDGMGRTGAFICIHAMLERVNSESVVDFFQFIKASRINRPDIVREQEHYILCHDTVADYIDTFQTYANFNV